MRTQSEDARFFSSASDNLVLLRHFPAYVNQQNARLRVFPSGILPKLHGHTSVKSVLPVPVWRISLAGFFLISVPGLSAPFFTIHEILSNFPDSSPTRGRAIFNIPRSSACAHFLKSSRLRTGNGVLQIPYRAAYSRHATGIFSPNTHISRHGA